MKFLVISVISIFVYCDSYKILILYPLPIKSISILGESHVRHLLNAGHEITYVTAFPLTNKPKKNYKEIDVSSNLEILKDDDGIKIDYIMNHGIVDVDINYIIPRCIDIAQRTFKHDQVKNLLENENEQFDLVLSDYFINNIYAALAVLYECPMIWSYSMGPHWLSISLVEDPPSPSYLIDYLSSGLAPFTFTGRILQLLSRIQWYALKWFYLDPAEEALYKDSFDLIFKKRGRKLPPFKEIVDNASLVFANAHNAFGDIPSLPQNYKLIGGIHIDHHQKPMSEDLKRVMDEAKNGVIYFSMGSTWQGKNIPKSVTEQLIEMFGELKETVVWKYEDDLQNLPKNVHIVKWAPQPAILAHPNCQFFITHGGLLSSIESVYFGVPVIGIPIAFDQIGNIKKAVKAKYGLIVELNYDLPNNLQKAIHAILSEPGYRQRARELSRIYHDRPVSPGRELVHWVEHVVRTRGAVHLRSPAFMVPWYQKIYLDLIFVIIGLIISLILLVNLVLRYIKATKKLKKK